MGSKEERRIAVVYGLGGVGKTQLVLNVVEKTSEEWDFVIFVDASSRETVEETLKEFAKVKGVGDTYNHTIEWLESCRERWIMILDNADTPSTNVRQYIPGGRHGGVLITTRLPDLVALAKGPDSACELSRMSDADSLALFMKIVRLEGGYLSEEEMISAKELLKVSRSVWHISFLIMDLNLGFRAPCSRNRPGWRIHRSFSWHDLH
jgi:hypothetical protein